MVPNPIYEGSPVYETIDPKVLPLRHAMKTSHNMHPSCGVRNESDESRYLDNPVSSTLGRDEVTLEKGSPDLKTMIIPCSEISPYGEQQPPIEDPYTIMSPAGRPAVVSAGRPETVAANETH